MRIGVDGYNLAMARGTGVATYGMELVTQARRLGHQVEGVFGLRVPRETSLREAAFFDAFQRRVDVPPKTNRYQRAWSFARSFRRPTPRAVPLTDQVEKQSFADAIPVFDRLISAGNLFGDAMTSFKATGRFVALRLPEPPDIMHWTYPLPITVAGSRNVYTLHDLVPLKLPYTTLDDKELYGRMIAQCVATAAQICTVSEATKQDIVDRFAIDPAWITVTYQTASTTQDAARSNEAADARAIEGIFGLQERGYFLYFGAIEPKKNVGRLIEAYLSMQTTTPLVIVGARAWQAEQELRLMPAGGASGAAGSFEGYRGQTIMRLDYLPRELLAKLVRGARAVVFPSLYEGFGLPVLEAMQLGTPVITSATSSMPEVAGDAGLLVNPYKVDEIQQAMSRLDSDAALCADMAARGRERAKLFSAERYGARLTELYASAMAHR